VNDGAPISLRQPGGCDVGDSTAWRWWGCYPVIGGVGSNGWQAVAPNAGFDDSICVTATSYQFNANHPPATAVGTWTLAASPGSDPVNFINISDPTTFGQGIDNIGTYTFVWDINYQGCPSTPDTVLITRVPLPVSAVAMADTNLGCDVDSLVIHANSPGAALGTWTVPQGTGIVANPNNNISAVTGLSPGFNQFEWTITDGICPATFDQVLVFVPVSVYADAGPDQYLCFQDIATLDANDPDSIQSSAAGIWTQLAGPSNAIFSNPANHHTNAAGMVPGVYYFVWTTSNGNCPVAHDTIYIRNYNAITADAGSDQTLCFGSPLTLSAIDISGVDSTAYGEWSEFSGPNQVVFADSSLYNTTVSNLVPGIYKLQWSVYNGTCPGDSQLVTIRIMQVQDHGLATSVIPDSGFTNGSAIVATPTGGSPPYTYSIDGLNFDSYPAFDSLGSGTYTIAIMDANGCTDTFQFTLGYYPPIDTFEPPIDTLKVPTGFSPNGDGTNDTWELPGIDQYPNAEIEVFNVWGGLVFRSVGTYRPWNGQRNSEDLPMANYYFIIDLKTSGMKPLKGSVTLLR
jgi:gliding motility-associated-like protein